MRDGEWLRRENLACVNELFISDLEAMLLAHLVCI